MSALGQAAFKGDIEKMEGLVSGASEDDNYTNVCDLIENVL